MWEEVGEEESLSFGTLQFSRMKGLFGPHSSPLEAYISCAASYLGGAAIFELAGRGPKER